MKSFARKNSHSHQIGLSVTALSAIVFATAQSAVAGTFNSAGYTWDSANSVQSGKIISGGASMSGFDGNFFTGTPEVANQTVGSILGFHPGASTSVELGDNLNRGVIELNWGDGMSLENAIGKSDFVVYENGTSPEAYAVAVRKVGASSFSEFLYKFTNSSEFGSNAAAFSTGFDLSDFGIADGEAIDAIRIANLIETDKVTGSDGQGFLGGNYDPLMGVGGNKFDISKFDADITYVAGLQAPKPVPEPGSVLSLLSLGVLGAGALLKRKQHKGA